MQCRNAKGSEPALNRPHNAVCQVCHKHTCSLANVSAWIAALPSQAISKEIALFDRAESATAPASSKEDREACMRAHKLCRPCFTSGTVMEGHPISLLPTSRLTSTLPDQESSWILRRLRQRQRTCKPNRRTCARPGNAAHSAQMFAEQKPIWSLPAGA